MNKLSDKIFQIIKENHGIYLEQLKKLLTDPEKTFGEDEIRKLISSGRITFIWEKYYPNVRSIGLIPKGEKETTKLIELSNEISIEELMDYFQPAEGDITFVEGYLIDETKKDLFIRTNNFVFDFVKYEYYLLSHFDNSNDINMPSAI